MQPDHQTGPASCEAHEEIRGRIDALSAALRSLGGRRLSEGPAAPSTVEAAVAACAEQLKDVTQRVGEQQRVVGEQQRVLGSLLASVAAIEAYQRKLLADPSPSGGNVADSAYRRGYASQQALLSLGGSAAPAQPQPQPQHTAAGLNGVGGSLGPLRKAHRWETPGAIAASAVPPSAPTVSATAVAAAALPAHAFIAAPPHARAELLGLGAGLHRVCRNEPKPDSNSCFRNSAVQLIRSCVPLRDACLTFDPALHAGDATAVWLLAPLKRLVEHLERHAGPYAASTAVLYALPGRSGQWPESRERYFTGEQQSAAEFLRTMLDDCAFDATRCGYSLAPAECCPDCKHALPDWPEQTKLTRTAANMLMLSAGAAGADGHRELTPAAFLQSTDSTCCATCGKHDTPHAVRLLAVPQTLVLDASAADCQTPWVVPTSMALPVDAFDAAAFDAAAAPRKAQRYSLRGLLHFSGPPSATGGAAGHFTATVWHSASERWVFADDSRYYASELFDVDGGCTKPCRGVVAVAYDLVGDDAHDVAPAAPRGVTASAHDEPPVAPQEPEPQPQPQPEPQPEPQPQPQEPPVAPQQHERPGQQLDPAEGPPRGVDATAEEEPAEGTRDGEVEPAERGATADAPVTP